MGFAEKKVELFQIVANADEELTDKLLTYASTIREKYQPSAETVAAYEKRGQDIVASGEKGFTREESMQMLRSLIK